MWAHTRKDIFLVVTGVVGFLGLLVPAVGFKQFSFWPLIGFAALEVFLICMNYQCVAHNAIHNPFFKWKPFNAVFSHFNTLVLGVPQSLYKVHHMNHHKYCNDLPGADGWTLDRSSTYRFSRSSGRPEGILRYSLLSPLRAELTWLFQEARKFGAWHLVLGETLALALFWLGLVSLNWKGFIFYYLPVWYLGQVAAYAENYFEHDGSIPGNRKTDSVSCYNPFYNWLWFNNGYHQEHHFRPQTHWVAIQALRSQMLPESQRAVVGGAHWFNWGAASKPHRRAKEALSL
jgi:fatty acid desaturase